MHFENPLERGLLIRRYKRFLADVETASGTAITIHCPNTGSMKNCLAPGAPVWYSTSSNPKRKYRHTWEIATTPDGHLAGINTTRANALVREALAAGVVGAVPVIEDLRAEVSYGAERSRIDFVANCAGKQVYIEVKNVTLCEPGGQGFFPDSISTRGARHLRELSKIVEQGHRALLVYCVQHTGITSVAPAAHIDNNYARAFAEAMRYGVEVIALGATISAERIYLNRNIPVVTA